MAAAGHIRTECSLCRSDQLDLCAKLPATPLANEFTLPDVQDAIDYYPLDLLMCRVCHHVQLAYLVDPGKLFNEYLYETSTSPQTVAHLREEARAVTTMITKTSWKEKPRILEIGSNDGTFLKELIDFGFDYHQVLGIEPSRTMSERATRNGIPTVRAFFDSNIDKVIRKGYVAIVANNVLAHVPSVRDVLEKISEHLSPDGILVMEIGSAADIFQGAFDVIYHEHTSYHALMPLRRALEDINLPVFDVERSGGEIGRGSLRVWAGRGRNPSKRMLDELVREEQMKLDDLGTWMKMLGRGRKSVVTEAEVEISSAFSRWNRSKKAPTILGYGAPAKLTTLTYACRVPRVAAVIEDSPWKIGRCTPGERIPIVSLKDGMAMRPDAIVAFAWNFADAIAKKLEAAEWRGELFVPLPEGRTIQVGRGP